MACCHGMADRFIVVGAGIFGVTAALELRARGHAVTLLDPGPIPAPLAASTDISKVVRMEYGPDRAYMALMEEARAGWLRWNERWAADGIGALYHDSGVLMVTRDLMAPGGFEHDSYRMLLARGHRPERMDAVTITRRYPAWSTGRFVDGFYHGKGGYAESGKVVSVLARQARADGVAVCEGSRMTALIEEACRVRGVRTDQGQALLADAVVLATGVWAGTLYPPLSGAIRASGHPVFHLRPADPALFRAERFPTFTADVARTGYYGFRSTRRGWSRSPPTRWVNRSIRTRRATWQPARRHACAIFSATPFRPWQTPPWCTRACACTPTRRTRISGSHAIRSGSG